MVEVNVVDHRNRGVFKWLSGSNYLDKSCKEEPKGGRILRLITCKAALYVRHTLGFSWTQCGNDLDGYWPGRPGSLFMVRQQCPRTLANRGNYVEAGKGERAFEMRTSLYTRSFTPGFISPQPPGQPSRLYRQRWPKKSSLRADRDPAYLCPWEYRRHYFACVSISVSHHPWQLQI